VEQLTEQLENTKLNTSDKPEGRNGKEIETNGDNDEVPVKKVSCMIQSLLFSKYLYTR
jgi:hypothetical protein